MKNKEKLWLSIPMLLVVTSQYNAFKVLTQGWHLEPVYVLSVYLSICTVHKWGDTLFQRIPIKPIALSIAMLYFPREIFLGAMNESPADWFKMTKSYLKVFKEMKGII